MFKWKKIGQVFNPTIESPYSWMSEQAQNPYAVEFENVIRVYFNTRSKRDLEGKSKSQPGYVELDKANLLKVTKISEKPLLSYGEKGTFDEYGVMSGSVQIVGKRMFMYYCGWSRLVSVPYNWAIGIAESFDGGQTFNRLGKGPLIGPTLEEPFLQAGCSGILQYSNLFHMFYTSGIKWLETESKPESVYQIMHATSKDGFSWARNGIPIIHNVYENEAQASPTIIKLGERWHMLFSFRHSIDFRNKERGYRIGYAWSDDLYTWHRDDKNVGISVSEEGWDSEMICYPHINLFGDNIYLFYCGNDFGKEGFGVAELIDYYE